MTRTREERIKEIARLASIADEVEKELLSIPGVSHLSVGLKVVNNLPTEEICFRVYVDRKKSLTEIPDAQRIPTQIRNVKTDVNEIPTNVSAAGVKVYDDAKYRPLAGGIKITSSKSPEAGTLGCMVIDETVNTEESNSNVALLTNHHVIMMNNEEKGHQVGQPDFCCDLCCCRCGEIAKVERGFWSEKNVDCAIAILTGDNLAGWTNDVLEIGPVSSLPLDDQGKPQAAYLPAVGDTVFKRGMSSGLTEGLIIEMMKPTKKVTVKYPTSQGIISRDFTGQIIVGPKDFKKPFSRKGDSGSVLINHLNQVIGLHFADNEVRDEKGNVTSDATQSYSNPIWDILPVLKISIPDAGTVQTLELRQSVTMTTTRNRDLLTDLEQTVEKHPDGILLIAAFKAHRTEVMNLINNDREVKVAWHRYHGPSFVAHLMEKIKAPEYNVPMEIEGVSYQRLLTKMSVMFEKKGSAELATAIETFSLKAFMLIATLIQSYNVTDKQL